MSKETFQYTKELTITVDSNVADICEMVYRLMHTTEGLERSIEWYAKEYNGGVGRKKAEAIIRKNGLFYLSRVRSARKFIKNELERVGPPKGKFDKGSYDPDFVYRLCEFHVRRLAKDEPEGGWASFIANLKKKYDDKDRINKRIGDRAQVMAAEMRIVLLAIERIEGLPASAYSKGKKK